MTTTKRPPWDVRLCLFTAGYVVLGLEAVMWFAPFGSVWPAILATPPILILAFLIFKQAF